MPRREQSEGSTSLGQVTVRAKTDRALLCELPDGEEVWFPLSQIHDDSEIYDSAQIGDTGELVVSEWLARQKGYA